MPFFFCYLARRSPPEGRSERDQGAPETRRKRSGDAAKGKSASVFSSFFSFAPEAEEERGVSFPEVGKGKSLLSFPSSSRGRVLSSSSARDRDGGRPRQKKWEICRRLAFLAARPRRGSSAPLSCLSHTPLSRSLLSSSLTRKKNKHQKRFLFLISCLLSDDAEPWVTVSPEAKAPRRKAGPRR